MDGKKHQITHHPKRKRGGEFQYMNSLCGVNSVSSAHHEELVTCAKCLDILKGEKDIEARKATRAKAKTRRKEAELHHKISP